MIVTLLVSLLLLPHLVWGASGDDDDVYGEDAIKYHVYEPPPGSKWVEQGLVLPPYPVEANLIRIDAGRPGFPYTIYIDGSSLSMGKDRVVRYTVVLRSKYGVDNISFEGIRCPHRQYKRYAYGDNGRFYPLSAGDWAFIRGQRQNFYRAVLADKYFCPLPMGDPVAGIRYKLKGSGGDDRYVFPGDDDDE